MPSSDGRPRHDRQQPADAAALLEVLVDHEALQDAEPGRELHHPVLRRGARPAERHHVRGHGARPGARPGEHGAAVVRQEERVAEPRPRHHRGEPRLVPAGEEDAGRALQRRDDGRVVRLLALLGSQTRSPCPEPSPGTAPGTCSVARSPSEEAVEMTTTRPSGPPANFANRDRIALSRSLSSAPPITITGPGGPEAGDGRQRALPSGVPRGQSSRRPPGPVSRRDPQRRRGRCARAAGRTQDQPVVRLLDVHDALERPVREERDPVALDDDVAVLRRRPPARIGRRPRSRHHADAGVGVEPPGRGVGLREDLRGPLGQLDHATMLPGPRRCRDAGTTYRAVRSVADAGLTRPPTRPAARRPRRRARRPLCGR